MKFSRYLLCVGFIVAAVTSDAVVCLLPLRPFPLLTAAVALIFYLLAIAALGLGLGVLKSGRRGPVVASALALAVTAHFSQLVFFFPCDCASVNSHDPRRVEMKKVWRFWRLRRAGEREPLPTVGFWGGRYHFRGSVTAGLVVWCDGPDGDNDNADRRVGRELCSFERTIGPWFRYPCPPWRRSLRKIALWEVMRVWGRFDGDVVWEGSPDGGLGLR